MERQKIRFASGDTECAAWHYPGTNGGCVVMTGGFAVTKEPGTDRFAERFNAAGFSVLAFDHRNFGESAGEPRQVARIPDQLDDWREAIAYAAALPGVERVAIWAFSLPGGYTVVFTGMQVLKHDGTTHHGIGTKPTVPVHRTIAGVAAKRDEVLEKAISVVGG